MANRTGTYMLKDGTEVRIQGISPIVVNEVMQATKKRLEEAGVPLRVPRYCIEAVGGDKIWFDHELSTLDVEGDPKQTAENHAAWDAYQRAQGTLEEENQRALLRAMLVFGLVDLPEMPQDESYWKRRQLMGLDVPLPQDRYAVWLSTEWVRNLGDFNGLTRAIGALSFEDVDWSAVGRIRETFPGEVPGPTVGADNGSEGAVGSGSDVGDDPGGEGVGD